MLGYNSGSTRYAQGPRATRAAPVTLRCAPKGAPRRVSDSQVLRGSLRSHLRTTAGVSHRPCSLIGAGTPVSLFPSPQRGMERREAPGGLRGLPWAFPCDRVRPARRSKRGDESRPGRATLLAIGRCDASRRSTSVRPEGPPRCTGCLPARRSAAGPSRLETGRTMGWFRLNIPV